jgi:hypothetical protein
MFADMLVAITYGAWGVSNSGGDRDSARDWMQNFIYAMALN